MKLRVEMPTSVIKNAYTTQNSANRYDANGNYMSTDNSYKTLIPVYVEYQIENRVVENNKIELMKLTKAELVDRLQSKNYIRQEIEVI